MDQAKFFNWNKNRGLNLKIGFIIALSFVILAFNWTVEDDPYTIPEEYLTESDPIEVVRTTQLEKPAPPPPSIKPTQVITEVEPMDFSNEPIPPKLETKIDVVSDQDLDIDYPSPPPPAPPPAPIEIEDDGPDFFIVVEEMPKFGDCTDMNLTKEARRLCSDKAFLTYMSKNIRYPAMARENNVQGTVVIQFVVEKDGSVADAVILRDIGAGCGKEALSVIKNMPDWAPGKQRGRKVRVQMKLPVHFRLN